MDFWKDAKAALATVAPLLGTAIGGPLGGTAANIIVSTLGLAPDTTPQQAAAAVVGASPEQLIALQKADQAFAAQMAQLNLDAAKLTIGDKADARAREIAVRDRTPAVLAFVLTAGFFGLLAVMVFHDVPEGSSTLLNIMLGALGSSFGMMVSYYYGSSAQPAPVRK